MKVNAVVKFCVPKASLPEREKLICRRVRVARELRGKTQQACADLTGIERSTLANYEAEITPVRFDQAKRICYRLNINQVWLATGANPYAPYFDLSPNLEFLIKPNALFSEAFDTVLKEPIQKQIDALVQWIGVKAYFAGKYDDAVLDSLHLAGEDSGRAAGFYVEKVIKMKFHQMPEQFRPKFAEALLAAEKSFLKQHGKDIEKLIRERQERDIAANHPLFDKKTDLTDAETSTRIAEVKSQLPSLLARLNRATKESGKMSALADFLGKASGQKVPLASVSRWLSGKREPGGEITLLMLRWAEQQERQK